MAKRKPKTADNAPRMAFGDSVLKEPWFHRACALATREETVATFGEAGGKVWDSIRVTAPEEPAEAVADADPDAWDPTPTYIDSHGNEYYESTYQTPVPGRSKSEVAGASAGAITIAVTDEDWAALESIADALDFSRKDDGGNCWYCCAKGNPEPLGEHGEDCPWRQANALMFRVGDALAGDPPGTTTIQGGPAFRCVTCGSGVWSHQAADNLLAVNKHQPAYTGDWTPAQCEAFDRASGMQRLGPGVVVADDQVDDGGNFVLCDDCTAHGLRVAEAIGKLALGTWRCPRCGHGDQPGDVVDPGRGDGPECDYCGLGVGQVPEWDTQDGLAVGPAIAPRFVAPRDTPPDDDVPF